MESTQWITSFMSEHSCLTFCLKRWESETKIFSSEEAYLKYHQHGQRLKLVKERDKLAINSAMSNLRLV